MITLNTNLKVVNKKINKKMLPDVRGKTLMMAQKMSIYGRINKHNKSL